MKRFDLELKGKQAMPVISIFILTVLLCLVGVFLLCVCQYNYVVSFRNRTPYRNRLLPEVFFPIMINEKTAQEQFEKN